MEFSWEKFLTAYQQADKGTKELIDSGIIADFVKNEISKESRLSENQQLLIVALSHYALKATPENEIVEILVTHGVKNVNRILNDLKSSHMETFSPTQTISSPTPSLASEISATEKEIASLQTVRTMSHDMAAIRPGSEIVYQASSQADILEREAAPVPLQETPRWETEQN